MLATQKPFKESCNRIASDGLCTNYYGFGNFTDCESLGGTVQNTPCETNNHSGACLVNSLERVYYWSHYFDTQAQSNCNDLGGAFSATYTTKESI